MRLEARISRLEGDHSERLIVGGTLFVYTDTDGQRRERVVLDLGGETIAADEFRARYPGGDLGGFQYAGVDPDWF